MFDNVLSDPQAKRRYCEMLFAPEIDRYMEWMYVQGYKRRSMQTYFWRLAAFSRYLESCGVRNIEEITEYVSPFVENWVEQSKERQQTKNPGRLSAKFKSSSIRQFIRYLERDGILEVPDPLPPEMQPSLLVIFCDFINFLRIERGLRESTIGLYKHYVRRFLYHIQDSNVFEWSELKSEHIHHFMKKQGITVGRRAMQCVCRALRSFLCFLRIEGYNLAPLVEKFPGPRIYRQEGAPSFIDAKQVESVLESVDRATPQGIRNYAILLLLIIYGMRAADVDRLTLDDLDWVNEKIHLKFRKSCRSDVLPLSHAVGEAILEYLQKARPRTSYRQVFLTFSAPHRPFKDAVSGIARKYLLAAGICPPNQRVGSHVFRYTSAHHLLKEGISYKIIGDYLGHSNAASTSVYLKVDLDGLLQVALNDGEDLL